MNVLIDTHALLWFFLGDTRLSKRARKIIESDKTTCVLSDASLWEISIKQSIGKLELAEPFDSRLTAALQRNAIEVMPIRRTHLFGVARLPFHHRDPFDRLLISAAVVENLTIITDGAAFTKYDVNLAW